VLVLGAFKEPLKDGYKGAARHTCFSALPGEVEAVPALFASQVEPHCPIPYIAFARLRDTGEVRRIL
jgi:hypothetical protein